MSNAPAVAWESVPWSGEQAEPGAMSRRQRLRSGGDYQAAIPALIAGYQPELAAQVAADAEDAVAEISRFDAEVTSALSRLAPTETDPLPPGELAPLASVLLRTESASSSQIEHVTAGAKALALATIDQRSGPNARMVAANVAAMQRAIELSDDLGVESLLAAHEALMQDQSYAEPGRFRSSPVWIGSASPTPHTATFVPPRPERISAAIQDLITFCQRTDLGVLVQVAAAHAQFETIHPFADGNGRTGRALIHALLRRSGTTRRMTVPISAGLLVDTRRYFDALGMFRVGDVNAIVECFTEASFAAVRNGRTLVADLTTMSARWTDALASRRGAAARTMLPVLIGQPAVTARFVQDHAQVSQPAAQRAIDQLTTAGILTAATSNRRNRVWIATEVTDALDAFAARAGRRS